MNEISKASPRLVEALKHIGGIETTSDLRDILHDTLHSSILLGVRKIRDEKYWKELGYESFEHYLDSPECRWFSKSKFYILDQHLDDEGPPIFNLFENLKIPKRMRRLLLDHGVKVVLDQKSGELLINGERTPATDKKAIIKIIDAFEETLEAKNQTIQRQQKKLDKIKEVNIRDEAAARSKSLNIVHFEMQPFIDKFFRVSESLRLFNLESERLHPHQKDEFRQKVWDMLCGHLHDIQQTFSIERTPTEITKEDLKQLEGKTEQEWFDAVIPMVSDAHDDALSHGVKQAANRAAQFNNDADADDRMPASDTEDDYVDGLLDRVLDGDPGDEDNDAELVAAMS